MSRVLLIHWNETEAKARARRLVAAGHKVRIHWETASEGLRSVRIEPPDAVVIDLARLPAHGRAVGIWLRQTKATRQVPILYIEGDPVKTTAVRKQLPDAIYTTWARIRSALRSALRQPPAAKPVVPATMAGYSGTPLPKKLGVREGRSVALLGAPDGFAATLGALPDGAALRTRGRSPADIVLVFARTKAELARRFPAAMRALSQGGRLWICWPKKTSALAGDLGEAGVRAFGLERGLVDFKICAVDGTWSGLAFARRRARLR